MTYYTESSKKCVSFYLLTNKHTFTKQVTLESLANNWTEWRKLFDLGNNVVMEYRVIVDKENEDRKSNFYLSKAGGDTAKKGDLKQVKKIAIAYNNIHLCC